MDKLIKKIEAFRKKHRMEKSAFGRQSMGDPHLLFDLDKGKRKLRLKTIGKIEDFMAKYIPNTGA